MNTDRIKEYMNKNLGKKVIAKINLGRNKHEYVEGIISGVYPYLFTITSDNGIKSFSYADVLIEDVILKIN